MSKRILIIEDDPALNQMLSLHFEDQGYRVFSAKACDPGLALAMTEPLDVILLDQQLPDGEGITLLPQLIAARPDAAVVMMTGQHDLELAIHAIKAGAADFIHKPLKTATLQATVDRVLTARSPEPEHVQSSRQSPPGDLIGRSQAMLEVSKQIALSAGNMATVLLSGESGTGKEVVARLIHQHSGRGGLCRGQLCRDRRHPARKRTVRTRKRRLHGCRPQQAGEIRAGSRWHAVPRRDR